MTDISACNATRSDRDHKCPVRQWCYRYICPKNPYLQTYTETPPFGDNGCELFWDMRNKEK